MPVASALYPGFRSGHSEVTQIVAQEGLRWGRRFVPLERPENG